MIDRIRRRGLLASALFIGLAATLGNPATSLAQSGDKTTLVIANSQWLDALRGQNLWAAIKKYEEVNPDVTLEQEAIPSAEFADKLTTEMGAGQGPDIAIMQEGLFYTMADAGFLVDVGS
ncbi:MAG: extracellular solute-binding protein, partial [Martelella sp.]